MAPVVREFDCLAFAVPQAVQSILKMTGDQLLAGFALDVQHRRGVEQDVSFLAGPTRAGATHDLDRASLRVDEQVAAQCAALRVEPFGATPQAHEHVLHHFLRSRDLVEHTPRQPEHRCAVPAIRLLQCGGASLGHSGDELAVVQKADITVLHTHD